MPHSLRPITCPDQPQPATTARLTLALLAVLCSAVSAPSASAMSNTSNPVNWRIEASTRFNEVSLDGLARLSYTLPSGSGSMCSGSLLDGGLYVLTAAHCVDNGKSNFRLEFGVVNDVAKANSSVSQVIMHPSWAGDVTTQADLALLKLSTPLTGAQGFQIHRSSALGQSVLMTGYGTTGLGGSNSPPSFSDRAYGHWGMNTFDATAIQFIDAAQAQGLPDLGTWSNAHGEIYVADFDNGDSRYNTLGRLNGLSSGLGIANEALISGGDSGGGDFVWDGKAWLLTGVHSWSWGFCSGRITNPSCDFSRANESGFGDLMGSTAVYSHVDWISSVTGMTAPVPEPGSWALMAAGLGLLAWRRNPQRPA
ncbi:MAG: trypsin-like serine protease [Roseateles asaccharophilus]|uniref:Putative secreted protein with PEP-CTERM sorting signal n=1 Tax=Roseateles asaccharophilus TaxID=582607 RepID=A0A4R6NE63_9BURK|nr:trypsin-like serine protease [Roseateles asaccharophilus]MDN3542965.1 trypsin-like serine protease [Roseateles asaccharophilus]TDP13335.1 putative secreted protein with PEP-CTERM sorting signal [Roseateles asaccharophilus]